MRRDEISPKRAWYCVILLTLLVVLAGLDRYILSVVVEDVTADLLISDKQMGILLGVGFSVVYSVAALPLAQYDLAGEGGALFSRKEQNGLPNGQGRCRKSRSVRSGRRHLHSPRR